MLSLVLLVPNVIHWDLNHTYEAPRKESFSPSLFRLQNVAEMASYTDSLAIAENKPVSSPDFLLLLERVVSQRFYHGFSRYSLHENWVAAVSENIFGHNMACIVNADDILKYKMAACSQQAIVTIALLKHYGIDYRTLSFPHHFALEAVAGDRWYFLDPNLEPDMPLTARMYRNWKGKSDELKRYYRPSVYQNINLGFGYKKDAVVSAINITPGKNISVFHTLSFYLSRLLWAIPLLILLYQSVPHKFFNYKKHTYSPYLLRHTGPVNLA